MPTPKPKKKRTSDRPAVLPGPDISHALQNNHQAAVYARDAAALSREAALARSPANRRRLIRDTEALLRRALVRAEAAGAELDAD